MSSRTDAAGGAALVRSAAVVVLVAVAAGLLVYGGGFHKTAVVTEKTVVLPAPPPPPTGTSAPGLVLPTFTKESLTKTEEVQISLTEPAVVKDVTVGGLTLAGGRVKRTYSGDSPAAACPT